MCTKQIERERDRATNEIERLLYRDCRTKQKKVRKMRFKHLDGILAVLAQEAVIVVLVPLERC